MFAKFFTGDLNRAYLLQCLGFLTTLCAVFAIASPFFIGVINLTNILTASSILGLLALGETFVIASGAIDLSTAATMALSAVACAYITQKFNISPELAIMISVSTGALCGFITGWLVNSTQAPSFIITLGMLSVERATAFILTGGIPIYGLPDRVTSIGQNSWLGISLSTIIMISSVIVAYLALSKTKFGKHTLLLGDNPSAAQAMGILVNRLRLQVFTLAGIFSGLAGFIFMCRTNSGDPTAGQNYELIAITAVVLGGANLYGGRATVLGTFAGILCLGVLQNGLNLLVISTFYQTLFIGIVLILASFLRRFGART